MFLPLPARPTPGSSGPVSSLLSPGRIPHLCKCGDKEWGAARPGSAVGSKRGPRAKLEVCVRLRERRGEVAEGRKGSPDPGGDAERLPAPPPRGVHEQAQGGVQTPLPVSFQETRTCGDRGRISGAHSLTVSFPYLPFLPAQSLVLFKVCGSWEFVQFFLGFEDPKAGTARRCFWSRQLPCWRT